MASATDVHYWVLPDKEEPQLLARVRWPDVSEAVSPGCPEWLDDLGLFDLPYNARSFQVSEREATMIAAAWGVALGPPELSGWMRPSLMRRMPADWSRLTPAEKSAWSLERAGKRHRRRQPEGSRLERRHWSRLASSVVPTAITRVFPRQVAAAVGPTSFAIPADKPDDVATALVITADKPDDVVSAVAIAADKPDDARGELTSGKHFMSSAAASADAIHQQGDEVVNGKHSFHDRPTESGAG